MDDLTAAQRHKNMCAIKSRDTKPELLVRRFLFSKGYRYRLQVRDLPGCPDIVMRKRKVVIFVNGCFWHQHKGCKFSRIPWNNRKYWADKLKRNVQRDLDAKQKLLSSGWRILIVWECALKTKRNLEQNQQKILNWLEGQDTYLEI